MHINKQHRQLTGFTLIEMLLVLVIAGMVLVMGIRYMEQRTFNLRVDRTTAQMQQILNAGLSYYVAHGAWPTDLACLQGANGCSIAYLPTIINPWGRVYGAVGGTSAQNPVLYTYTSIPAAANTVTAVTTATAIANRLPLSYITATPPAANGVPPNDNTCVISGSTGPNKCYIVASVNIPGQNLNNARAINFAGLYHNGACVPVPTCPVDANGNTMTPQIMVVPASISGVYDAPTNTGTCTASDQSGCAVNVYPISSFTAYATTSSATPNSCGAGGTTPVPSQPCAADSSGTAISTPPASGLYWRVCLATITEKGTVNPNTNPWGQIQGTVMAITRCVANNEPVGSGFTVWTGN